MCEERLCIDHTRTPKNANRKWFFKGGGEPCNCMYYERKCETISIDADTPCLPTWAWIAHLLAVVNTNAISFIHFLVSAIATRYFTWEFIKSSVYACSYFFLCFFFEPVYIYEECFKDTHNPNLENIKATTTKIHL